GDRGRVSCGWICGGAAAGPGPSLGGSFTAASTLGGSGSPGAAAGRSATRGGAGTNRRAAGRVVEGAAGGDCKRGVAWRASALNSLLSLVRFGAVWVGSNSGVTRGVIFCVVCGRGEGTKKLFGSRSNNATTAA